MGKHKKDKQSDKNCTHDNISIYIGYAGRVVKQCLDCREVLDSWWPDRHREDDK